MFNNVTTGYDMSDATWEIIIMLLIAFILGFILRHLFCCCKPNENDDTSKINEQADTIVNEVSGPTRVELAWRALDDKPAVAPTAVAIESETAEPESLQKVEGIGPKIEGLLHAGGILTMRQLAQADLNVIQKILDDAGPRYRMHKPKSWPAQAELIADEKWDELEKYQDFLVAGRE